MGKIFVAIFGVLNIVLDATQRKYTVGDFAARLRTQASERECYFASNLRVRFVQQSAWSRATLELQDRNRETRSHTPSRVLRDPDLASYIPTTREGKEGLEPCAFARCLV